MKLRILLVGNYTADMQKSMASFARMMEKILIESGYYVELLNPPIVLLPKDMKPQGFWKWVAYIDKFLLFPFALRSKAKDFDIVHICDHSNAMYASNLKKIPVVVTCHDVLAIEAAKGLIPGWSVGVSGKIFQKLILQGIDKADAVVCVSNYTKTHLQALGSCVRNSTVALNSLNADFRPAKDKDIHNTISQVGLSKEKKYFLHVGSDLERKNRLFVLKVFAILRKKRPTESYELLFVGPQPSTKMATFISNENLNDVVFSTQNVTHEMLNSLYSGAAGLIFPSLQEGFGWPIIEAQASGCPVFTSNFLPMTEVGGEAAVYIDPNDEKVAAEIINNSLDNLDNIRENGFQNIKRFSLEALKNSYEFAYHMAKKKAA